MNRAAQSLAWAGIALVALGMTLAVVAVVTARLQTVDHTAAQVQVGTTESLLAPPLVTPDSVTDDGSTTLQEGSSASNSPDGGGTGGASSDPEGPGATGLLGVTPNGLPTAPESETGDPTLTTATAGSLEQRLVATAESAGFVVFELEQPGWYVTALDAGGQGDAAYVTLAYENGEDYINLSQSPSGTRPSLANAEPIALRGLTAEIFVMQPVLLLRWDEEGTGLLFSTDLSQERALALAGRLQPLR